MRVLISLLRGVNVGGHHKVRMSDLREVYESLGLRDVTPYLQSGNVVFKTDARDLAGLARRVENAIEGKVGFKPRVILRTSAEMRDVVRRNPFAGRDALDPSRLAVIFLDADPGERTREQVRRIQADVEELHIDGCEVFIYFPNGMGRSKLPAVLGRVLTVQATGRNWNTVKKLVETADALEHAAK